MSQAPHAQIPDDDDEPAPSWTRWFTLVSMVLAIIALTITIWTVGPSQLIAQFRRVGWWFAAIIGLEAVITCVDAAALSGFLGQGGRRPGYGHVLRAQLSGRAINAVTPLGSLGEATKATMLLERTSTSRAVAAVVRYNLASLGMLLLAITIGAPICALTLDLPRWMTLALVTGSAVGALLLVGGTVLVRRGMLVSLIDFFARLRVVPRRKVGPWRAKLAKIDHHLKGRGSRRQRWTPAGWVVLSRMLGWTSIWMILAVVDHAPSIGTMGAMVTAGTLISLVAALVPMGLGVSEGGNAALFSALGEAPLLGVTVVLARRVTLIIYATIGLTLLVTSRTVDRVRSKRPAGASAPSATARA